MFGPVGVLRNHCLLHQHWRLLLLQYACLHDKYMKRGGKRRFLNPFPFVTGCSFLVFASGVQCCDIAQVLLATGKLFPQNRSCVLFEISLNKPHLHLATYRSKQCPNVLCLSSLTYHSDALTCCYTHLCFSHKARVLLNQHIVSRQD